MSSNSKGKFIPKTQLFWDPGIENFQKFKFNYFIFFFFFKVLLLMFTYVSCRQSSSQVDAFKASSVYKNMLFEKACCVAYSENGYQFEGVTNKMFEHSEVGT